MAEKSCPGQGPSLLDYQLAGCNAVIECVERAEAFYRENAPVEAALELHNAVARIRAHLNGEDI